MEEIKEKSNWGLAFGIISFVVALLSLIPGYLSIIPLLGLAFAVITMIAAGVAIILGIIGIIGSRTKWPSIVGVSIGALLLAWGLIRLLLVTYTFTPSTSS